VYSFVAATSGFVQASLDGLTADLDLLVIADSPLSGVCDALESSVCLAGGYSGASGTAAESVRWQAQAGQTYYVIVDGYAGNSSSFNLSIETDVGDIVLGEIGLGGDDYIELHNRGACSFDLGGLSILHDASLAEPITYTFPNGIDIAAAAVIRVVESTSAPFLANELSAGMSIPDLPAGVGYTVLCNGTCDTIGCTNLLDYVERDDNDSDATVPEGPDCASFAPGPVDAAGQSGEVSLHRTGFAGQATDFQASDWSWGPASRD
jgi:hypothetical protein